VAKQGLYANIHAKRERIKAGSGEKMRKVGSEGAPSAKDFKESAKTAKPTRREMIASKMKDMWCLKKKRLSPKTAYYNPTKNPRWRNSNDCA